MGYSLIISSEAVSGLTEAQLQHTTQQPFQTSVRIIHPLNDGPTSKPKHRHQLFYSLAVIEASLTQNCFLKQKYVVIKNAMITFVRLMSTISAGFPG